MRFERGWVSPISSNGILLIISFLVAFISQLHFSLCHLIFISVSIALTLIASIKKFVSLLYLLLFFALKSFEALYFYSWLTIYYLFCLLCAICAKKLCFYISLAHNRFAKKRHNLCGNIRKKARNTKCFVIFFFECCRA